MAKKYKRRKKQVRLTKNQAIALAIFLLIVIVVGVFLYKKGYIRFGDDGLSGSQNGPALQTDELSIHFPMLGNKNSGDCTLIKTGNTEVLIDAGSTRGSAATIVPYIKQYCTDGVLEYVIATHAHEDHIAAFVGSSTSSTDGVFENFVCDTIIDFPLHNTNSGIYNDYVQLRDAENAKHYTALECWNAGVNGENAVKEGARRQFVLDEGITLNILYHKFYETKTSDENDYSVCVLLTQGNKNYLFTGDLEGAGEKSLVANNSLPEVELFKAGHHGSPTSSSAELLDIIKPKNVVVCCCCGNHKEYNFSSMDVVFPSQQFVTNVAKWTENVYVTTLYDEENDSFLPMNGNIVFTSDGLVLNLWCSEIKTKFKDTEWFSKNRVWNTGP